MSSYRVFRQMVLFSLQRVTFVTSVLNNCRLLVVPNVSVIVLLIGFFLVLVHSTRKHFVAATFYRLYQVTCFEKKAVKSLASAIVETGSMQLIFRGV